MNCSLLWDICTPLYDKMGIISFHHCFCTCLSVLLSHSMQWQATHIEALTIELHMESPKVAKRNLKQTICDNDYTCDSNLNWSSALIHALKEKSFDTKISTNIQNITNEDEIIL